MSEFGFKGGQLGKAPETRILEIKEALRTTEGDLLAAGLSQRTRILQRTANHIDVDGNPFAPYSENGPYYYRPWDRPGLKGKVAARRQTVTLASRQRSTSTFFRRIGGRRGELKVKGELLASIAGRERDTIKFESYAAFKRALGRSGVDLTGPRAPHMMQAIEVKAGGSKVTGNAAGADGSSAPATELVLGIYGPKAKIATGHNTGENPRTKLPKRRFFGASNDDAKKMLAEIFAHVKARLGIGS